MNFCLLADSSHMAHESQVALPPPEPIPSSWVYSSGVIAGLLLFYAILKQATRFVEACKD